MTPFRHAALLTQGLALLLATALTGSGTRLAAQTPPPPPPPKESDGTEMRGVSGSFDLSKVPVPEVDREARKPKLTPEEKKVGAVMLAVAPMGYIPKPIIFIDKAGMPRERYRNPLEFPPTTYHVKTKKGTIRILAGQNRIGPFTQVPRLPQLEFSFEIPPGPDDDADDLTRKGPRLRSLGNITVGADTTHLLALVWKPANKKLWSKPLVKVIDVSPSRGKINEAWTVNTSPRDLVVQTSGEARQLSSGFIGRVPLPINKRGDLRLALGARIGKDVLRLSDTVLRPQKFSLPFLLAWPEPRSQAQPTGVGFIPLLKNLPPAEPFPQEE